MIVPLLVALGKAVLPVLVVDGGRAIVRGVRRRRAAKREDQPSECPFGRPTVDACSAGICDACLEERGLPRKARGSRG